MSIKRERYLEWAVVSIFVGAFLSLAVAWLTVWVFVRSEYVSDPTRSPRQYVLRAFGTGPEDTRWTLDLEQYSFGIYMGTLINWEGKYDRLLNPPERSGSNSTPRWSRARTPTDDQFYGHIVNEVAAGFPFTSWKGEWRKEGGVDPTEYWYCVPVIYKSKLRYPILLPFMPIFPGAIFNALFWGGIFFVFTTDTKRSIWFFIRHGRRRRGLCPHCGYDIAGLAICPECGQAIKAPSS